MFESIHNFRDIGGIQTNEGKRIEKGRLLRSGELYQVSDKDKTILEKEFGLRLIVDFRSDEEVSKSPDSEIGQAEYMHIDLMKAFPESSASRDRMMEVLSVQRVDDKMKGVYRNLVLDQTARSEYAGFLKTVAALDGGSCLFHCFAGKDRTGVAAMLILEILGAKRADIFRDYLLTNDLRASANESICAQAAAGGIASEQLEALKRLLEVKEEYLQCAYDEIEKNYGSVSSYLTKGLGLDQGVLEQFRSNYTV